MRSLTIDPRQKGSALLIILMIIGVGAVALLVNALNKANMQIARDKITAAALAQAKEALIGYATTYRDRNANTVFGYLPCPDMGRGTEGLEDSSGCIDAGNKDINVIGRLPWRTLGLPPLRDGSGECLWYAVSGNFKNKTKTDLMSWDSNGQLEIFASDGTSKIAGALPTNRAVAIVFSPGTPLTGQNRTADALVVAPECGGNMDATNYLDTATVSGTTFSNYLVNASTSFTAAKHVIDTAANQIKQFISATVKDTNGNVTINDQLLFITPDDLFANKIVKRSDFSSLLAGSATTNMLYKTAECIAQYGLTVNSATKRLPWASPLSMTAYGTNSLYDATLGTLEAGRTPYKADVANTQWLDVSNVIDCPNFDASAFAWWQNYKDQIFYAVADAFKPGAGVADCIADPTKCLTVDGVGPYAAVILFSGKKLAGQNRNTNTDYTSTDKSTLSNYLEGLNLTAMAAPGNGNFTRGSFASASNNDILICIKSNLTIDPTCQAP